MTGIYKITSPSNRIYIGQSRNLDRRKKEYEKYIKNSNRQVKLLASINKYGWQNHVFEIIEECSIELLNKKERYWQEFYNSIEEGLNCIYTKTTDKPSKFGAETKEKMRKSRLGKKASEETKQKMSKIRNGYKLSEETKKKISSTKLSKRPADFKEIIRNKNNYKAITCISPDNIFFEFKSCKDAAKFIGVSHSSIYNVLYKSITGKVKGWHSFIMLNPNDKYLANSDILGLPCFIISKLARYLSFGLSIIKLCHPFTLPVIDLYKTL